MEDRPGAHDRLGPAEEVLDLEEIAVAQDRLKRGDLRVGAEHENPVETRLLGELAGLLLLIFGLELGTEAGICRC